ncbi:D-ribose ABC transporter substrate-binding protein [Thermostaphylospora chromogena]|uniref:Monosaccharide ABC transporter substrate-binding protein, CUT2 family n=1 Tax=Thermostaphylospora chromogena TaxID=35622 RepID=A0A1H1GS17_9ACTN|nr:D-ribose ABC transporter substrate-binding protein [Thermostaphylospora chromogena]SDR16004.1 monosaccharide ABC transporter substrate-binding protein, CUT2 family [Thermostaphylospora chromogena]
MFRKIASVAATGLLALCLTSCGGSDTASTADGSGDGKGGTIAVITVDLANSYWQTEADTAKAEIEKAGYKATVNAHNSDPDKQNQLIDTAISNKVKAIILDPAGADESVPAVRKATDAGIPVFLVNAEISEQGIAKSQIISNNAQGATLGAEAWVEAMGGKGKYVELYGNPTDNNAQVRSDGYAAVISAYPDLEKVGQETANWDRVQGKEKMEGLIAAHPDIDGVIAGNDEMALGAIEALKDAGMIDKVKVLGFDGNADAVQAVKDGTMVATVLQPIVQGTKNAVAQAISYIEKGETGVPDEKQSIDCVLITKDNADKYTAPFVLEE